MGVTTKMTHTIEIIGSDPPITVTGIPCPYCPGNALVMASRYQDHQNRHLYGDFLECCKCLKGLPRDNFETRVHVKAPICHACRPKPAQRQGKGRPTVREKVNVYVGRGGMSNR